MNLRIGTTYPSPGSGDRLSAPGLLGLTDFGVVRTLGMYGCCSHDPLSADPGVAAPGPARDVLLRTGGAGRSASRLRKIGLDRSQPPRFTRRSRPLLPEGQGSLHRSANLTDAVFSGPHRPGESFRSFFVSDRRGSGAVGRSRPGRQAPLTPSSDPAHVAELILSPLPV